MKQIIQFFLEGESPTLRQRLYCIFFTFAKTSCRKLMCSQFSLFLEAIMRVMMRVLDLSTRVTWFEFQQ